MDRGARGVTLVELMVVVAIVGLLAAMFLTRFAEARRDAAEGRAVDLLDQLRRAVMSYEAKTGTYPQNMAWGWGNYDAWVAQIESVLGDMRLPRQAQASAVIADIWGVAGNWGDPYGMGLYPQGGRGGWYRATPYQLMRCPNGPWDPTGCQVIQ